MSNTQDLRQHPVKWTPEKISRFWDFQISNPHNRSNYFSREVGSALLRLAKPYLNKTDSILSFGCGPGYLLEELLTNNFSAGGVDFSPDSVKEANNRLNKFSSFQGVKHVNGLPTSLAAGSYDFIFFIETLEHLLSEQITETLNEFKRLLKPSGRLLVTVPNGENLERFRVVCPDCGAIFHRMQHLQSFSKETLTNLMEANHIKTEICEPTLLTNRFRAAWLYRFYVRYYSRFLGKLPHLIYVGKKNV